MPSVLPGSVSADPLAERGTSVRSPLSWPRFDPAQGLGQAPVHHQRLAVLADDDVRRLDVAVQHAAAVGVVDGVADVDEPCGAACASASERPAGSLVRVDIAVEPFDRLLEAIALDEPHRVVRPAAAVGAQAVDRDDARVFEPPGDLGLQRRTAGG